MFSRNFVLLAIFGVLLAANVALSQSWQTVSMGDSSWAVTPGGMVPLSGSGSWGTPMGGGWAAMPMSSWSSMGAGERVGGGGWAAPMGTGTWSSMAGSGWAKRK